MEDGRGPLRYPQKYHGVWGRPHRPAGPACLGHSKYLGLLGSSKATFTYALILVEALGLGGRTALRELERFPMYTSAKVHFLIWTYMALHMYLGT